MVDDTLLASKIAAVRDAVARIRAVLPRTSDAFLGDRTAREIVVLNLFVALLIATVKAGLVVTYFMHLRWDKKFHLILFLTSVLFLILFLSISLTDRSEYEHDIEFFRASQQQAAP